MSKMYKKTLAVKQYPRRLTKQNINKVRKRDRQLYKQSGYTYAIIFVIALVSLIIVWGSTNG